MKKFLIVLVVCFGVVFFALHLAFAQNANETDVKKAEAPVAAPAPQAEAAPVAEELDAAMPAEDAMPLPPLTAEKKTAIQKEAEKLIKEEITAVGSFEVDHPETGDLINLSLEAVLADVTQSGEGEYMVKANFKDKAGAAYVVAIYLDEISAGEYELADAIVESIDGKAISGV